MSNTTTGTITMNTSAAKSAPAKKITKKSDAAPAAAAVPAAAPAPAPAAPKVVKAKAAAVPAPAPVAEATVVSVAAGAIVSTVADEIVALIASLTTIRDAAAKAIHTAKALEKKNVRELRLASKRRRVKRSETVEEGAEPKEKRPSVFTIPVTLKDSLCTFLGKPKGTQMAPAEVTRAVKNYIDAHKLKGEKHEIRPDTAMCSVLGVQSGEILTYRNIQKYLYKLYDLKSGKVAATA
jgi:hypothetical protein